MATGRVLHTGPLPGTRRHYDLSEVSEKKKILVADDSETIRALLQTTLESAG